MGYQITELQMGQHDEVVERKVVPHPFETRELAEKTVESMIAKYNESGYNPEQDYWWAKAANGDKMRFLIEGVR